MVDRGFLSLVCYVRWHQETDAGTTYTGRFRSAKVEKEIRVKDDKELRIGQKIGGNDTDIHKDSRIVRGLRTWWIVLQIRTGEHHYTIWF